jgi:hypothetical protein
VMLAGNDHFKRFVIFIFANFTCSHTTSLSREATSSVVCFFVSNGL